MTTSNKLQTFRFPPTNRCDFILRIPARKKNDITDTNSIKLSANDQSVVPLDAEIAFLDSGQADTLASSLSREPLTKRLKSSTHGIPKFDLEMPKLSNNSGLTTEIHAHSSVLFHTSSFFSELLRADPDLQELELLFDPKMTPLGVLTCIRWCYESLRDCLDLTLNESISDVLYAAHYFDIKKLEMSIENELVLRVQQLRSRRLGSKTKEGQNENKDKRNDDEISDIFSTLQQILEIARQFHLKKLVGITTVQLQMETRKSRYEGYA